MANKKNLHPALPVLLLVLQAYFVLHGGHLFGRYLNPVLLFFVSAAIPFYYLKLLISENAEKAIPARSKTKSKLFAALLGIGSIGICCTGLPHLFAGYVPPGFSDVIPQLQTLYDRFAHGIFPYQPVPMNGYSAYPVYMPFHWLPIGISAALHIDSRWSGIILLAIAVGIYAYTTYSTRHKGWANILAILLPSLVLLGYIIPGSVDMQVSLETVIAAYYVVLATGLLSRNLFITAAGIILCLLSRYTFVFWLPLFFILLWQHLPPKANLLLYSSIIFSVAVFYVIPFLLRDNSIFIKGLRYHNDAVLGEWIGHGNPPESGTFQYGVYFAPFVKKLSYGAMGMRALLSRAIQGLSMIVLLGASIIGYRRWREKINFYDYSMAALYLFLLLFFMCGPLCYPYYYMPLLFMSAIICGKMVLLASAQKSAGTA